MKVKAFLIVLVMMFMTVTVFAHAVAAEELDEDLSGSFEEQVMDGDEYALGDFHFKLPEGWTEKVITEGEEAEYYALKTSSLKGSTTGGLP